MDVVCPALVLLDPTRSTIEHFFLSLVVWGCEFHAAPLLLTAPRPRVLAHYMVDRVLRTKTF